MKSYGKFTIRKFKFDDGICAQLADDFQYAKDNWPIVYILVGKKNIYIGETADPYTRFEAHLKDTSKSDLTTIFLIASDCFHKSATQDLEAFLIKNFAGDDKFIVNNGNLGLANHHYHQKNEFYDKLFISIWKKLIRLKLAKHSLEYIRNSDLFKYSPFKTLSRDQKRGLVLIIESLLDETSRYVVIEGGAGTGKTLLATFVFKLLVTPKEDFNFSDFGDDDFRFYDLAKALKEKYPDPDKVALIVPMSSFRETLKKVFRKVKGLKEEMVIGPKDVAIKKYDFVLVEESHRLRRYKNLGRYIEYFKQTCALLKMDKEASTELDWIRQEVKKSIFFYDELQSIKPSDVRYADFYQLKKSFDTRTGKLQSQLRILGGIDYVDFVERLLSCQLGRNEKISPKNYEFKLYNKFRKFERHIISYNKKFGLARLAAGYAWPWPSKENPELFDICIEGVYKRWNHPIIDWINSKNSINQIGCIHTTQGYDLNYAGIIFGPEISYDPKKNEIIILKENYYDDSGRKGILDPGELKNYILNIYRTLMLRGIRGTYVYVFDDKLRAYFAKHIVTATS